MITSHTCIVNKLHLRYIQAGEGPPVVLLHGFAYSADNWHDTMNFLAKQGYRAIALDLPGFGESDKPGDMVYSLHFSADMVHGFLDALGIQRVPIIAHSYGSKIALALALLYPAYVSKLVVVDSDGFINQPLFVRKVFSLPIIGNGLMSFVASPNVLPKFLQEAYAHPERHITDEELTALRDVLTQPDRRRVLQLISNYYKENDLRGSGLRSRLGELRCPTLIVWGDKDRIVHPSCAEIARREIPGAKLVMFPDCGHFPHIEYAHAFQGLILGFLAKEPT